ncbi:MAG: HEAT repeat domain-containing protein [Deltaproteobacteria bacterium]|nr:HEAT repeat domain-containing protein [Deltaproteobacteria bacterium]
MSDVVIASIARLLDVEPNNHDLRRHLVGLLVAAGRGQEALANTYRLLETQPDDRETLGFAVASAKLAANVELAARFSRLLAGLELLDARDSSIERNASAPDGRAAPPAPRTDDAPPGGTAFGSDSDPAAIALDSRADPAVEGTEALPTHDDSRAPSPAEATKPPPVTSSTKQQVDAGWPSSATEGWGIEPRSDAWGDPEMAESDRDGGSTAVDSFALSAVQELLSAAPSLDAPFDSAETSISRAPSDELAHDAATLHSPGESSGAHELIALLSSPPPPRTPDDFPRPSEAPIPFDPLPLDNPIHGAFAAPEAVEDSFRISDPKFDAPGLDLPVDLDAGAENQTSLSVASPLRILFGCAMSKVTGALRIQSPRGGFRIHYQDGCVTEVVTTVPSADFLDFLAARGLLPSDLPSRIPLAARAAPSRARAAVLDHAAVRPEVLPAAMDAWTRAVLTELVQVMTGSAQFVPGEPRAPAVPHTLTRFDAPLVGARGAPTPPATVQALIELGDAPLQSFRQGDVTLSDLPLTLEERHVSEWLATDKNLGKLLSVMKPDDPRREVVFRLVNLGMSADLLRPPSARELAQFRKVAALRSELSALATKTPREILGLGEEPTIAELRARISELDLAHKPDPEGEISELATARKELIQSFAAAAAVIVDEIKARKGRTPSGGATRNVELTSDKPMTSAPKSTGELPPTAPASALGVPSEGSHTELATAPMPPIVDAPGADSKKTPEALVAGAREAGKKGRYSDAVYMLSRAQQLDREHETRYLVLAIYFRALGASMDRQRAASLGAAWIESLLSTHVEAEAWALLGSLRKKYGDREGSLAAFERALQLDPNQTDAKTEVRMARRRTGDTSEILAERQGRGVASQAFSFLEKKLGRGQDVPEQKPDKNHLRFLLAKLGREPEVVVRAIQELEKLGDREATAPLIALLDAPHEGTAEAAAHALGVLADPSSARALKSTAQTASSPRVRAAAKAAFERLHRPGA